MTSKERGGQSWPWVALKVGIVAIVVLTACFLIADAITDGEIVSEETACQLGGGAWNRSNGSCSVSEFETVPDCSEVEAPGPTFLWCPWPLGLLAMIAGLLAIVGAVLSWLGPVVEEGEDRDG